MPDQIIVQNPIDFDLKEEDGSRVTAEYSAAEGEWVIVQATC